LPTSRLCPPSTYRVEHEDWVATEPLATARVKKVEAGRVSYVTITTTDTGTYSSDAMMSPHVQYPGISVERVADSSEIRFWSGRGWSALLPAKAKSFLYYNAGATSILQLGDTVCVLGARYAVC
jgi:hypothetical protein